MPELIGTRTTAEAVKELSHRDSTMAMLISEIGPINLTGQKDAFETLCELVVGQQLSGVVADRIISRIRALDGLSCGLTPHAVSEVPHDTLIACGVSKAKAEYMKLHAALFLENPNFMMSLERVPDEEAVSELTRIRGIGPWTASILLMSCHSRSDIFPHGDGTLDRMINELYGIERKKNRTEYFGLVDQWSPHRTLAARYLWRWADREK